MEKQRSIKVLSVVALIVAVLGLTVAFALLNETLNITGSGSVGNSAGTWNVHFDSEFEVSTVGNNLNDEQLEENVLVSTNSVSLGTITLKAPGDMVYYTFTVTNDGTQSAEISSETLKPKQCTGSGDSANADATLVCGSLRYEYQILDENGGNLEATNYVLEPGKTITVELWVGYSSSATQLPIDDVFVNNLGLELVFTQAD